VNGVAGLMSKEFCECLVAKYCKTKLGPAPSFFTLFEEPCDSRAAFSSPKGKRFDFR
jgi:hypothetical protein